MLTSADGSREGAGVLFGGEGGRVVLVGADVTADSGASEEIGVSLAERVGA